MTKRALGSLLEKTDPNPKEYDKTIALRSEKEKLGNPLSKEA